MASLMTVLIFPAMSITVVPAVRLVQVHLVRIMQQSHAIKALVFFSVKLVIGTATEIPTMAVRFHRRLTLAAADL